MPAGVWACRDAGEEQPEHLGEVLVEHDVEQFLLALEVRVERALRVAGVVRDVVDRRVMQPLAREDPRSRAARTLVCKRMMSAARSSPCCPHAECMRLPVVCEARTRRYAN
ncbi:MAG: hypothetical protein ACSLFR_03775 [Solirubrobacteraceae bacterium]